MNLKISMPLALVFIWVCSTASAAEIAWPRSSAAEFSVFFASQMIRDQIDECSPYIDSPALKPKLGLMKDRLTDRLKAISKELLESEEFRGINDIRISSDFVDAMKDHHDRGVRELQSVANPDLCLRAIAGLALMTNDSDESLKEMLKKTMKEVRKVILEPGSLR